MFEWPLVSKNKYSNGKLVMRNHFSESVGSSFMIISEIESLADLRRETENVAF